jgi:hypothetical protein
MMQVFIGLVLACDRQPTLSAAKESGNIDNIQNGLAFTQRRA